MAEAHQAVRFSGFSEPDSSNRNILLTAVKCLYHLYEQKFEEIKNKFYNGLYLTKPESWQRITTLTCLLSILNVDLSLGIIPLIQIYFESKLFCQPNKAYILATFVFSTFLWSVVVVLKKYLLMCLYSYTKWIYEIHGTISWKTKIWAVFVKLCQGRNPSFYSFQGSLPRLPLPTVSDTIRRFLSSIEPLLDEDCFKRMQELAKEFEQKDAPKLQRYLWLKRFWANNYVSDWWEEYVYLHSRSPIVVNSNIYGMDTISRHPTTLQAARAAQCLSAVVNYMLLLIGEKLDPVLINNMVPLCVAQYKRTFTTTRIPGVTKDTVLHYAHIPRHIVVMHAGRYFKMRLLHNNRWLDEREFERIFQTILDDKSQPTVGEDKLAAFTAGERTCWAVARRQFFSSGVNAASMNVIERAAFVLCLDTDEYIPNGFTESDDLDHYARAMLHGNGCDRWFDKSFNLVVGRNCYVGFNAEHSWADAPVICHLWEMTLSCKTNYDDFGHCRGRTNTELPTPRRLQWDISDQCIDAMNISLQVAMNLIEDVDIHVFPHRAYGKSFVCAQRLSPDAYTQLALQLTAYRNLGQFCLTYEASMTRLYLEGRTETVRSCTNASVAFIKSMEDPNCSTNERLKKLRAAADYHQVLYLDAMTGKGVDRHLFCLYVVSRYMGVESLFLKEVLSQPWRLSTSQTPHGQTKSVRNLPQFSDYISMGGGFGPVSDDGYGVSYITASDNTTFFHISSKRSCPLTDSKVFASQLAKVLTEMRALFEN